MSGGTCLLTFLPLTFLRLALIRLTLLRLGSARFKLLQFSFRIPHDHLGSFQLCSGFLDLRLFVFSHDAKFADSEVASSHKACSAFLAQAYADTRLLVIEEAHFQPRRDSD